VGPAINPQKVSLAIWNILLVYVLAVSALVKSGFIMTAQKEVEFKPRWSKNKNLLARDNDR